MITLTAYSRQLRWLLMGLFCLCLAALAALLYNLPSASVARSSAALTQLCSDIAHSVDQVFPDQQRPLAQPEQIDFMQNRLDMGLEQAPGVEGGLWQRQAGFFAYSFPSYNGREVRSHADDTEQQRVLANVNDVAAGDQPLVLQAQQGQTLLQLTAICPLASHEDAVVWLATERGIISNGLLITLTAIITTLAVMLVLIMVLQHRFVSSWYQRRDELAESLQDEDQLVPLTTDIPEMQPMLFLLQASRARIKELQQSLDEVDSRGSEEQRLIEMGQLASALANEVKAPLETIHRRASQLSQVAAKTYQGRLDEILREAAHIEHTLEGLLLLNDRRDIKRTTIQLQPWLNAIANSHRELSESRQVAVTALADEHDSISIDSLQLRYAVDNLVLNALSFAPSGSEVLVRAHQASGRMLISVSDEGPGVSPAMRKQLFDAKARSRKQVYGMGLAMVRTIAHAHGGEVRYEDLTPGGRFIIDLPMTTA
ncbi:sensor histidine kinase [Idiomarina xiamenensis]|uniref:histidine kinase n=1 Tax=Idiomarina xiamenensis 10-D-4 TaxID=740709 RepID=K2KLS4_9GAMM|nr:HAMP domain-containing sensor histidine kinase [Idiomarina xiamenensis]EKE87522.1 Signal transduction histidine kinase [Idiomarina xiamenensis 10-D-4]